MTATPEPAAGSALARYRAAAAAAETLARRTQLRAATWRLSPADHALLVAELAGMALHTGTAIDREASAATASTRCHPGREADDLEAAIRSAAGQADIAARQLRETHAALTREVSLIRAAGHPAGACSPTLPASLTAACVSRAAMQTLAEAADQPASPARIHLQIITLIQQILTDLATAVAHEATLADVALAGAGQDAAAAEVLALLISARRGAESAAQLLRPVHAVLQAVADSHQDPR
jgi:hypothetical protein